MIFYSLFSDFFCVLFPFQMLVIDVIPNNAVDVAINHSKRSFMLSVIPSRTHCTIITIKHDNKTIAPKIRFDDKWPDDAEKISRITLFFSFFIK